MSSQRPDEEPAGLPPEWADFVVPDDISSLDDEIRTIRAELYGKRRRRPEPSGLLLLSVLIVALFFAGLGVFLQPAGPPPPSARPLAHPSAAPGDTDALLPDLAPATGRNGTLRLRNIRPAVIVVLSPGCSCGPLVTQVIAGTAPSKLKVVVLGPTRDPVLASTVPRSRVYVGTDTGGRLAAAYAAVDQPLLLFVRSDGTVSRVMVGAEPSREVNQQINQEIAGLAH